jgi:hypothetical protein
MITGIVPLVPAENSFIFAKFIKHVGKVHTYKVQNFMRRIPMSN